MSGSAGGVSGEGDIVKIGDGALDLSQADNTGFRGQLLIEGGFVAAGTQDNLGPTAI